MSTKETKKEGCSSCDEKAKQVTGKITAEQLSTIKQQQENITQLLRDIGYLESQKHG